MKEYIAKGGSDPYIIKTAISTLSEYKRVNIDLGVAEEKLFEIPFLDAYIGECLNVGVDLKSKEELFYDCGSTFTKICENRHSVRLYDTKSEKISEQEILEGISIAQNCPSACNRQAVRVKVITKPNMIKEICEIQGGARGFGENSGALLIITSDISLYEPAERRIPMLDCGIFIMNLIYSLYEKRIGTCVLNGSFNLEREKRMREVVPIPANEMYAAIISLSKIPDGESIKVARSIKRDVRDIVDIL